MRSQLREVEVKPSVLIGAIDALPDHLAILDAEGTILFVNRAWTEFGLANGLAPGEAGVGAGYVEACEAGVSQGDANARLARDAIVDMLAGRLATASFEYPCHSPDTQRWFIFRAARFESAEGAFVAVLHTNITSRHMSEDALRSSHASLESFNLAVAHDIRGPLRRILELSRLSRAGGHDPAQAAKLLERIETEAQRARALADDLLDLSRLDSATLTLEDVDVSGLAEQTIARLAAAEPERQVSIDIQPGLRARADSRLVAAILENLLANAWKFTRGRDGARIELSATSTDGGPVCYLVRDNGIGFQAKDASRIFRPFARLPNAAAVEGTGVGLALVERAVSRLGGRVWATGSPGRGASFFFTLGGK